MIYPPQRKPAEMPWTLINGFFFFFFIPPFSYGMHTYISLYERHDPEYHLFSFSNSFKKIQINKTLALLSCELTLK